MFFWFDFIDATNSLLEYSVKKIGDRILTSSDNTVSAIYYKDIPNIILCSSDEEIPDFISRYGDYKIFYVPQDLSDLFSISTKGNSAVEQIYSLINKNLLVNDTITLSSVPIYYLEPNTRIFVECKENNIYGDYIINSISIPLQVGGTSSI